MLRGQLWYQCSVPLLCHNEFYCHAALTEWKMLKAVKQAQSPHKGKFDTQTNGDRSTSLLCPGMVDFTGHGKKKHDSIFNQSDYKIFKVSYIIVNINLFRTANPQYTQAGVYGKCVS